MDSDDDDDSVWDFKSMKGFKRATQPQPAGNRKKKIKNDETSKSPFQKKKCSFLYPFSHTTLIYAKSKHEKRIKEYHSLEPVTKKKRNKLKSEALNISDSDCFKVSQINASESQNHEEAKKSIKEECEDNFKRKKTSPVTYHKNKNSLKSRRSLSLTKSKKETKTLNTPTSRKIHEGFCPFCQMPFSALKIQSPDRHTEECMDLEIGATVECPDGLTCDSTLQSHYRRFSHNMLAQSRAAHSSQLSTSQDELPKTASEICTSSLCSVTDKLKDVVVSQSFSGCEKSNNNTKLSDLFVKSPCKLASKTKAASKSPKTKTIKRSSSKSPKTKMLRSPSSKSPSNKILKNVNSGSSYNIANLFSSIEKKNVNKTSNNCGQEKGEQKDCEKINVFNGDKFRTGTDSHELLQPSGNDAAVLKLDSESECDLANSSIDSVTLSHSAVIKESLNMSGDGDQGKGTSGVSSGEKCVSANNDDCQDGNKAEIMKSEDKSETVNNGEKSKMIKSGEQSEMVKTENCEKVENMEDQQTVIQTSLEDDAFADYFNDDMEYPDIETPELLQDGSVKVEKNHSDKFFSSSLSSSEKTFPENNNAIIEDNIKINTSETWANKMTDRHCVGNTVDDSITPSLLLNRTKQTSMFNYFKNKITGFANSKNDSCKTKITKFVQEPQKSVSKPFGNRKLSPQQKELLNNVQLEVKTTEVVLPTQNSQKGSRGRKYNCPFYKKIPDTSITVDAFRYGIIAGCKAYILTHFHYDHYGGLTKRFSQPLYCTKVTGNLVKTKIKVDERYINVLPMDEPCIVDDVELTLMEANHCPGAVIILFRLKNGKTFLHTGDFRASPEMEEYPPLIGTKIDLLYLDTTYCSPSHVFPSQKDVIQFTVNLVQLTLEQNSRTLVVCGTYTIGKEKIFLAIAEAINSKIGVARDKKVILDCLESERLKNRITLNLEDSQVHVLPMAKLRWQNLKDHLSQFPDFNQILALEPTGWTYSKKMTSLDHIRPKYNKMGIIIYGVPYSEHSSFLEMKRFTQFIRPGKILPTVNNGNPQSRKDMEDYFKSWMDELDRPLVTTTNKQSSIDHWL